MRTGGIQGTHHLRNGGRWAFAEFCDVYEIESNSAAKAEAKSGERIDQAAKGSA